MKIAIILPGHLRAWEFCKDNFLTHLYDTKHDIDVFVDTYDQVFRTDYQINNECDMKVQYSKEQILQMFDGINVVDFKVEPELTGSSEANQIRKILKIVDSYDEYEKIHGKYDLVVRSRFDIVLDNPLIYDSILASCQGTNYVHIGKGGVNNINDMFAICSSDMFKLYGRRFLRWNTHMGAIHGTMHEIGAQYDASIGMSIVRLDANKKYYLHK